MIVRSPPAIAASDERPLGTMRTPPANPVHCMQGVALPVAATITLWRCVTDPPEDESGVADQPWSHAFMVERHGEALQYYRDEVMAGALDSWRVVDADMDGEGNEEHIVALWNSEGNGLGVNVWTLHMFDRDWRLLDTRTDVQDWGRSAVVAAPDGRAGCDLLVSTYEADFEKPDGPMTGTMFVATFVTVAGGRFEAVTDRPILRRRLDIRFMRQRVARTDGDGWTIERDVARWLEPVSDGAAGETAGY